MAHRREKIKELLHHELALLIERDFGAPGVLLTVMGVEISEDGQHAKVSVSAFPADAQEQALARLERAIFFIQQEINRRLKMRPVPKIRFVPDASNAEASHIDEILRRVKNDGLTKQRKTPLSHASRQKPKTQRRVRPVARPH